MSTADRDVVLRSRDLTRRFGGLVAVDRVSIELARGQVHAVIGTNGAGKSTLINVLSGELPASAGTVELRGVEGDGIKLDVGGEQLTVPLTEIAMANLVFRF